MSVERQLMMCAGGATQQYTISNSLRFRASASAYLNRTPASAGNSQTWTWSGWIKKGNITVFEHLFGAASSVSNRFSFNFDNSVSTGTNGDYLCAFIVLGGTVTNLFQTNALFRDPSSWYHVVLAVDTTQAIATNRLKLYVNGVQQTFSTYNAPAQNTAMLVNSAIAHNIASGAYSAGTYCFDGYMAEINFIDGQALTPSSFGETSSTTGVWIPKKYTGSYGTNGFYLSFNNNTSTTALGYDTSGNGNNWTPNNFSLTTGSTYDSMIDSPTSYASGANNVGNYAVLNPLAYSGSNTATSGNLTANLVVSSGAYGIRSTFPISSGMKSYFEVNVTSANTWAAFGILDISYAVGGGNYSFSVGSNCVLYYRVSGQKIVNGTTSAYSGNTFANGDIIGVAIDYVNNTCEFFKNNTSQGSINLPSTTVNYVPVALDVNNQNATYDFNFGQRPFAYTPPSGYNALNTYNLSTPSIVDGSKQFAASLYTGTGSSLSVSGANFTPGMVWVKSRSAATDHALYDVIRGTQARLESNTTDAEVTSDNGVTAFNSTGFTVGTLAQVNTSSATYVGWQWKANGTAVTNTAGSITSSVSANQTAGFSVVTWTGTAASAATVGHGLGVAPNLVIIKQRNGSTYGWVCYHSSLGAGSYIVLNSTGASAADTAMFNNTAPTSSVFTLSSGGDIVITNPSAGTMVAYCFAAIPGYSAFGSYTGNGSSDGPFVYCGFRPRYLLVKNASDVRDWCVWDTSRSPYNLINTYLVPNLSLQEISDNTVSIDALSNGFKIRGTWAGENGSGNTIIYAAFAENPFKYSLAR